MRRLLYWVYVWFCMRRNIVSANWESVPISHPDAQRELRKQTLRDGGYMDET